MNPNPVAGSRDVSPAFPRRKSCRPQSPGKRVRAAIKRALFLCKRSYGSYAPVDTKIGEHYGVRLKDGPFEGLFARAVVVIDAQGRMVYNQLVAEIADEPDYATALQALGG